MMIYALRTILKAQGQVSLSGAAPEALSRNATSLDTTRRLDADRA